MRLLMRLVRLLMRLLILALSLLLAGAEMAAAQPYPSPTLSGMTMFGHTGCMFANGTAPVTFVSCGGGSGSPGGSSGQLQWNNLGSFAGVTMGGDGTMNTSTGVLTVTQTNGSPFTALATTAPGTNVAGAIGNALNAANGLPNIDGSIVTGHCLEWGPGIEDAGSACGSGNVSNTGTPTINQLAVWNSSTVVEGLTTLPTAAMPTLTGDVTTAGGALATTLATVNANTGSFGSSTSIPSFTVNGKGLITAASGNVVIAAAGTLTGTTLNSTVVTSSLTSVGTLTAGATGSGFTVALGSSSITGQLPLTNGGTNASLTASNGGVIYSTGSALAVLAGTVTANQCLLSGASAAPSWGSCSGGGAAVSSVSNSDGSILSTPTTGAVVVSIAELLAGTPVVGSLLNTEVVAPSTPAAGKVSTWVDSTDARFHDKNPAGTIGTTVIANAGTTHQWVASMSAAGVLTTSQPAFTDLSGSLALTAMATQATNTIVANVTSGSAAPTAVAEPSCSGAGSASNWTTNTGPGCNTSITAAAVPATGVTAGALGSSVTINNANWSGTVLSAANGGSGVASPAAHSLLQGEGASAFGVITAATAGNIIVDQGSGSDWLSKTVGGDCTMSSAASLTCTKTSGVAFGTFATASAATATNVQTGTSTTTVVTPSALNGSAALQTVTETSNAATVNWQSGFNAVTTLNGNLTTLTLSNPRDGICYTFRVIQPASGGPYTVTWPSAVDWGTAGAPTLTTVASKIDMATLCYYAAATKYHSTIALGF